VPPSVPDRRPNRLFPLQKLKRKSRVDRIKSMCDDGAENMRPLYFDDPKSGGIATPNARGSQPTLRWGDLR
jgi:hypothetical protein